MLLTDELSLQPLSSCLFMVSQSHSLGKDWKGLLGLCSHRGLRIPWAERPPGASRAEAWLLLTFDLLSVHFFPALDFAWGTGFVRFFTELLLSRMKPL